MEPPSRDFISRNSMDAQQFAFGGWPGDHRHGRPAFFAYVHPAPETFPGHELTLGGWSPQLGEYLLDCDDVLQAGDPHAALDIGRAVFRHACTVCDWDGGRGERRGRASPDPIEEPSDGGHVVRSS